MLVRVEGNVIFVNALQPQKVLYSITETPSGISNCVKVSQCRNAPQPMVVKLSGSSISGSDVHPLNASPPILVMLSGRLMFVKEEQSLNALCPILVILSGKLTLTRDVQLANNILSIIVIPSGISMVVNFTHPLNA